MAANEAWSGLDVGDTTLDVTHELTDYLTRLADEKQRRTMLDQEALGLSESSGVNFAEAALVLQQSTTVYGKKVDLLRNITLEACEVLAVNPISMQNGKGKKSRVQRAARKQQGVDASIDTLPYLSLPLNFIGRFKPPKTTDHQVQTHTAKSAVAAFPGSFCNFKTETHSLPPALVESVQDKPNEPLISTKCLQWPVDPVGGVLVMDEVMLNLIPREMDHDTSSTTVLRNAAPDNLPMLMRTNLEEGTTIDRHSAPYADDNSFTENRLTAMRGDATTPWHGTEARYTELPEHRISAIADRTSINDRNQQLQETDEKAIDVDRSVVTKHDKFAKLDPYRDLKGNKPAEVKHPNRGGDLPNIFSDSLDSVSQLGLNRFELLAHATDPTFLQSLSQMNPSELQMSCFEFNSASFAPTVNTAQQAELGTELRTLFGRHCDPSQNKTGFMDGEGTHLIDNVGVAIHHLIHRSGLESVCTLTNGSDLLRPKSSVNRALRKVQDVYGTHASDIPSTMSYMNKLLYGGTKRDLMELDNTWTKAQVEPSKAPELMAKWKMNKQVQAYRSQFRSLPGIFTVRILNRKADRLNLSGLLGTSASHILHQMLSQLKEKKSTRAKPDIRKPSENTAKTPILGMSARVQSTMNNMPVWAVMDEITIDMGTAARYLPRTITDTEMPDDQFGDDDYHHDDTDNNLLQAEAFDQAQIVVDETTAEDETTGIIQQMKNRVESLVTSIVQDHAIEDIIDDAVMSADTEIHDRLTKKKQELKHESTLRMKEWNKKVPQFLSSLEDEKEFDIGAYRKGIVDKMNKSNLEFHSITKEDNVVEKSRNFLTALLMTTNGSVTIKQIDDAPSEAKGLSLPKSSSSFFVELIDRGAALLEDGTEGEQVDVRVRKPSKIGRKR